MRSLHKVPYTEHSGGNMPVWLSCELNQMLFSRSTILFEKMTRETVIIQTRIFGRCFLKKMNIMNLFHQGRQLTVFVAHYKIQVFKQKLVLKNSNVLSWAWQLSNAFKHFSSEINSDTYKCDFFILPNKMFQQLECLCNSANQYFSKD